MAISDALGEASVVEVPAAGPVAVRSRGTGPAVVFVHGAAVNGDLWRKVVPGLAGDHHCVTLDVPLGGHSLPVREDADLSLYGVAGIVADVVEGLGLEDVTLVGNDTGGAVCQALVGSRPERIGRLVLTSCDAFENFPPKAVAYLKPTARVPALMWLLVKGAMSVKALQRTPMAYGWATRKPIDPEIVDSFLHGLRSDALIRRDFARMLRAADKADTVRAAEGLRGFDRPALVAWADGDKFFPRADGQRLAELLPQGRFELVADSRTFIPEDQPERLVELLRRF